MKTQEETFRCASCGHVWEGHLLADIPLLDAAIYMRGLECPQCHAGSDKVFLHGPADA